MFFAKNLFPSSRFHNGSEVGWLSDRGHGDECPHRPWAQQHRAAGAAGPGSKRAENRMSGGYSRFGAVCRQGIIFKTKSSLLLFLPVLPYIWAVGFAASKISPSATREKAVSWEDPSGSRPWGKGSPNTSLPSGSLAAYEKESTQYPPGRHSAWPPQSEKAGEGVPGSPSPWEDAWGGFKLKGSLILQAQRFPGPRSPLSAHPTRPPTGRDPTRVCSHTQENTPALMRGLDQDNGSKCQIG